jgi:formyl-CoA transferase
VFFKLLQTADIFVDGFAGAACTRLGIGYDEQRAVKPDIIYCQSSGFGARGKYAEVPTHGFMMMAHAGAIHLDLSDDGFARQTPDPDAVFGGTFSAPIVGALYAALTAIAALRRRDATGEGAYIDASASDAAMSLRASDIVNLWNRDRITDASSVPNVGHPNSPKYDFYETKDGKFMVFAAIEPKFWRNWCKAVDRPDLAEVIDERFAVDFSDLGGADLAREIQRIFHTRTLDEWMTVALEYDIAMGPANHTADLLSDPHLQDREIIYDSVHPHAGPFKTVGWPAPVAGQPFEVNQQAPLVGEHTDAVLAGLGLSAEEIAALREQGDIES